MDLNNIVMPMEEPNRKKLTLEEAIKLKMPIRASIDTVIVIHIVEPEQERSSGLYIPEHVKESMAANSNLLVKGLVRSVGPNSQGRIPHVVEGDIVYVWPHGYESRITIDGIDYPIYGDRDIKAIVNGN